RAINEIIRTPCDSPDNLLLNTCLFPSFRRSTISADGVQRAVSNLDEDLSISRAMLRIPRFVLLLTLFLSACGSDDQPRPVTIGAVFNLSGGQEALGQPSWNGARLAAAQINATGGLLGQPLSLLIADGKTDPTALAAASTQLLDRHVAALFGLSDT